MAPSQQRQHIPYRNVQLTQENRDAGWHGYYKDCFVYAPNNRYRENGKIFRTNDLQKAIAKATKKNLTAIVETKYGYECRSGTKIYKNPLKNWRTGMACYVKSDMPCFHLEGPYKTDWVCSRNLREYESPYDFEEIQDSLENETHIVPGLEVIGDAPPYPFYTDYLDNTPSQNLKKNTESVLEILGNAPTYMCYN